MRATIYDRVSLDRRDGASVDQQSMENRAACAEYGWTIAAEYQDNDRSASRYARKAREQWPAVLADLEAGRFDVLVLWESSRGDRELAPWARLLDVCREHGVLVHITSHDRTYDVRKPRDWKTLAEDGVNNAYSSEETAMRGKRAKRAAAAAGRPHGKLLYGYTRRYDPDTGTLANQIVNEEQAEIIREAARRVLAGETPYAVAKDFNARGIPAPRGGRWDLTQIKRLCVNPAYIAKRVHQGVVVGDADWPPILSEADHYTLVAKLNDPTRRTQRDSAVRHLLSGIAVCGVCDGRIRVQKNRGFDAYLCTSGFHVSRSETWVDSYVSRVVVERLARPDALAAFHRDHGGDVQAARDEAAEKRTRLQGFYDAAARGEITPAALARIENQLLPEITAAERRATIPAVPSVLRQYARPDIAKLWDGLPITVRREIIDVLMTVRIVPTRRGARSLDPESVEIIWK